MTPRANVKPLTHWLIYKGYTVRFTQRAATIVAGVLTTPAGPLAFTYDPVTRAVTLPDRVIHLNEYGWEVTPDPTPPPRAAA